MVSHRMWQDMRETLRLLLQRNHAGEYRQLSEASKVSDIFSSRYSNSEDACCTEDFVDPGFGIFLDKNFSFKVAVDKISISALRRLCSMCISSFL